MSGIGHLLNATKIPMETCHGPPTFYNRKLLEIALTNVAVFSLYVAWIKLRSSGGDWCGLIVGKNVVDMIAIVILLKLKNQWWLILGFGELFVDCSQQ